MTPSHHFSAQPHHFHPSSDIQGSLARTADLLHGLNLPQIPSWRDRLVQEMLKHFRPEMACILACEVGEKAGEVALYQAGVEQWNQGALPLGFAAGLSYAMVHIYQHAKAHGVKPSWSDALKQALTAESGCVVGATTTEWLAGTLANTNTPYEAQSLLYSALGLPVAFAVGLSAMSITALVRKDIFARAVVGKNEVPDGLKECESDLSQLDLTLNINGKGNRMFITGRRSSLKIQTGPVPDHLKAEYPPAAHELALLRHPLARRGPSLVEPMRRFFKEAVGGVLVTNPYECTGHHAHLSHPSGDHAHAHSHKGHTHDHGHEALTPALVPVHSHSHGHGPCKHRH